MEKIVILGKGGHTASIVDALESKKEYEIAGYVVNDEPGTSDENYPVLGDDEELERIFQSGIRNAAMGVGYLGKSDIRERLWIKLKKIGYNFPVIYDSTAIIAHDTFIGEGSFIGKGAIINTNTQIGKMCIINTGAIIEHDCYIEDFSHISVGSVLCGNVYVGQASFIGANATIIQGKKVGNRCIVAAGATIRKNMEDAHMAWSNEKVRSISGGGYKLISEEVYAA
ncbi:MAG: acetyltransferase [Clostridium sp.]|nr:acetyltransferase [Clostridium sp.]